MNGWASARNDIVLIVCGSATSWIIGKLINNKGGLHNRITKNIYLAPFSLRECEDYYRKMGITWNRHQIVESYMVFGGIPYYMSLLQKKYSLAQNIDKLFFSQNSELRNKFGRLYSSLFKQSGNYVKVVEALALKTKGLTREEILSATKLNDGGGLTIILNDLEQCGFIRKYRGFDKKNRMSLFQLIDSYSLFYLKMILKNDYEDEHFWSNSINTSQHKAWSEYAFEQVCLAHIQQIKAKLGITGVQSKIASWKSRGTKMMLRLIF